MIIKSVSEFKSRKKYKIYGKDMNLILTYKQMKKYYTDAEIQELINDGKIVEY